MALLVCKGCCNLLNQCCTGCAAIFEGCCTCVGDICHACADVICNPERPFPLSVFFSTIYSVAVFIYGLVQLISNFNDFGSCTQPITAAVLCCLVLCIIHLLFGFYSFYRFHKMKEQQSGLCERTYKFLLYDWGMCIYIIVFIFALIWYGMSIFWSNAAICSSTVPNKTALHLAILGFCYLIASIIVALLSLCCEACCNCCQKGPFQTLHEAVQTVPPIPSRNKKPVVVYPNYQQQPPVLTQQGYPPQGPVFTQQGYPQQGPPVFTQQGYPPQGPPVFTPQGYPQQGHPQNYSPVPR